MKIKFCVGATLFALLLVLGASVGLRAQSGTSSVQGTVTDKSGAVVSGADVVLTNNATGVRIASK